jgi:uncharacterized protein (TIGR02145 family)
MEKTNKQSSKFIFTILASIIVFNSCKFVIDTDFNTHSPGVVTLDTSIITNTSITLWGQITDEGNDEMEEVGFCYNTTGNPTVNNGTKIICSYDTIVFSTQITGLTKSTTYYVVAYARNDAGLSYGSVLELKTVSYTFEYFIDKRDNKKYKTITIGKQVWMAENLAYLPELNYKYSDYSTTPNYYVYNYKGNSVEEAKETVYFKKYGVLYNWYAAMVVVPDGWRIPTKQDYEILAKYIGDQNGGYDKNEDSWYQVGNQLKEEHGWGGSTSNEYGFSLLPANYIEPAYNLSSTEGYFTYLWTSTEGKFNQMYIALVQKQRDDLWLTTKTKSVCCSIRLIKE